MENIGVTIEDKILKLDNKKFIPKTNTANMYEVYIRYTEVEKIKLFGKDSIGN
ncbi:Uncharacterised protein [uncultured Clostridium sp.]|nr:Uncharacterised protein [uncultured Clostridium sp.]SCJ46864.1 Uncharacterised protein [uncultured Clostridium sp.]